MCDHLYRAGSRIVFRDRVEGLAYHSGEVIDVLRSFHAYRDHDSYGLVWRYIRRNADHGATFMQMGEGDGTRAFAYCHVADCEGFGTDELVGDCYLKSRVRSEVPYYDVAARLLPDLDQFFWFADLGDFQVSTK